MQEGKYISGSETDLTEVEPEERSVFMNKVKKLQKLKLCVSLFTALEFEKIKRIEERKKRKDSSIEEL